MPRLPHIVFACCLLLASWGQTLAGEPDASAPTQNSRLTADLFYQLVVSELSLQNEDIVSAYALMVDAARRAADSRLFQRAVDIALRGRDANAALDASKAWQQALPDSPEADRYLLQILIGLNRSAEAVPAAQRLLARADDADRAATIVFVSRFFTRVNDKPLAADLLEKVLAADLVRASSAPVAWAMVGNLRLLAKDPSGALAAARNGVTFNAFSDEVALLCVNLLDSDFDSAQALLIPYLAGKATPDVRMGYVRKLLELQRYPEALAQLETLNTTRPDYPEAWLIRGSIELQNQSVGKAERSLRRYLALMPAAEPRDETNDDDARTTGPGAVQAYLLLSQIAQRNQDPAQALAYLAQINSPQDTAKIQLRRAMVLAQQGNMDEARALIRQLPEKDREDARNKINLELQLLRDNRQEQAAYTLLEQALKSYADDPDLRYELAMSAEKLGRPDEMEQILRSLIAAKPDYHAAYNALGYSLAERNLRLNEARDLIQKALELAPEDPFIVDSLAWVEFRSGNLAEALALLQKAFKARPDPEIAAHLGEVLWALRRPDQASAAWKEGLELNRENETLKSTILRLRGSL